MTFSVVALLAVFGLAVLLTQARADIGRLEERIEALSVEAIASDRHFHTAEDVVGIASTISLSEVVDRIEDLEVMKEDDEPSSAIFGDPLEQRVEELERRTQEIADSSVGAHFTTTECLEFNRGRVEWDQIRCNW